MQRILIIKLGALGDVIRTTSLLRVLKGEVTWVTKENALPLLQDNPFIQNVVFIDQALPVLQGKHFNLVINLEEDARTFALVDAVTKDELIGVYYTGDRVLYTDSSAEWFDMSLISRYGKTEADRRKKANIRSYQEMLFGMLGKRFNGEEYVLPDVVSEAVDSTSSKLVGIEARSGERWMAKRWARFPRFLECLRERNIPYLEFEECPTLLDFIRMINRTDIVVTTDSLALHIALGLKKKIVVLFTCTSPDEIYDYGRLTKIASPLLHQYYYSTERTLEPGKAIAVEEVLSVFDTYFKLS